MMKMMSSSPASGGGGQVNISSIQKASKNWQSFDWSGKIKQWESITTQTTQNKEARESARKELVDQTKSFKRAIKNVDNSGRMLASDQMDDNTAAASKAIEAVSKQAKITIKSYKGAFLLFS